MNYAIFKQIGDSQPHVVHRFTQQQCNHKAKLAATRKLLEMWHRVMQRPSFISSAVATRNEFSYIHRSSSVTCERIRYFIAPLKEE